MGVFENLLEGGEQNIMRRCNGIVSLAEKANKAVKSLIKGGGSVKIIKGIEEDSDDVAFELTNIVTGGGVAPNLIDDLLELIDKEDSIVDSVYNLARELNRYKIKNAKIRSVLANRIGEMSDLADAALRELYNMQKSDKLAEIKKFRAEIEKLEERGDDLKDSLFDMAYDAETDFKAFYHIFEVAHEADNVLDSCEDSSDMYLTIMSSILT